MYIGFIGKDAVPGKDGADWTATTTAAFESSIKVLGDKLVAGLSVRSVVKPHPKRLPLECPRGVC